MAAPVPGTPAYYRSRATPIPKQGPQKYFTFRQPPPDSGYGKGDVLKLGPNQKAQWNKGLGWSAVAKPKVNIVKRATPQNSLTRIETVQQVEDRVRKLADENFARQQGVLDTHAASLRKEAEGRRVALQNAYQVAAQMNAGLGTNIQGGWNEAARTIQGMANTGTGAVAEGLQGDLATQEQALSRVGAGGTGFDARSQSGVEAYRGGTLPGEFFARQGGSGNQWMNQDALALAARGWQEPLVTEGEERTKIESDYQSQLADLQTGRGDYENDLRKQLMGARQDQLDAKTAADKAVQTALSNQSKLRQQYMIAKMNATTKKQLQQVEMIFKNADLEQKGQLIAAQNEQRYASAEASRATAAAKAITAPAQAAQAQAAAALAGVRAEDIRLHPGTGGGAKPKKPKTVNDIINQARVAIGTGKYFGKPHPYDQNVFNYLWTMYKNSVPKAQQAALRKALREYSKVAPKPAPRAAGDVLGGMPA